MAATRGHRATYVVKNDSKHSSSDTHTVGEEGGNGHDSKDKDNSVSKPSPFLALRPKIMKALMVVVVGAVTALSVGAGDGSWSIRG